MIQGPPQPAGRRDADGRLLCRWCSKPLSGRRTSWCSQACVDEARWWWVGGAGRRAIIFEEDRGVCAECGVDTDQIQRIVEKMIHRARRPFGRTETQEEFEVRIVRESRLRHFVRRLEAAGFSGRFSWDRARDLPFSVKRSLWEADHIKPRILGGGDERANFRTLCIPCHKAATRRLAKHRALKRRKQEPLFAGKEFI